MSYEQYSKTSRNYDVTRQPIGLPILLGCFSAGGRQLRELSILDAGCGTGSFAMAILPWVRLVRGVDASTEMIAQAEKKALAAGIPRSQFWMEQGTLEALPFSDGMFDAAMVNQVLHHLEDSPELGYPRHRGALQELWRVLRPGAPLVVNMCSHTQLEAGWWYRDLFPEAFERFKRKLIPVETFIGLLRECGFSHEGTYVPTDAVFQGQAYFDPTGPLRETWRDGDSVFALATKEELEGGCSRIVEMNKRGVLGDYLREQDAERGAVGQVTFLHAVKDAAE